jgi:hypothetical protein
MREKEKPKTEYKNHRLDLNSFEIEVLLRACRKYRSTLPIYLQSSQDELKALNGLIERFENRLE